MKKHLLYLPAAALLLSAVGCEPEETPRKWDYPNTDVVIFVEDAMGNDRLDPGKTGLFIGRGITVTYGGESYTVKSFQGSTRADGPNLPVWEGLRHWKSWNTPGRLALGQFSIDTREYRAEPLTIDWGDDSAPSSVTFDLYPISNGATEEPTINQAIRIVSGFGAGTKSDDSLILTIVK